MSTELYPSDESLAALGGVTDSISGVYFPAKGEGPDWYLSFVKCLYRLIKNVSVVSGLRVFKTGDLTFSVKPGMFFDGNTFVHFTNTAQFTLNNDTTNYVYLTTDGQVHVSITGFPDASITRHIRLATIITASGNFTDENIIDYRQAHICQPAGLVSHIAAGAVGGTQLANDIAAMLPKLAFTVSGESSNINSVTIQVQNARGEVLAGRFLLTCWLADSAYGGETYTPPNTATTWTAGNVLEESSAGKRWCVETDSNGIATLAITETGSHVWYMNASINGRVYASNGISFS
jgi:hypothetical protein